MGLGYASTQLTLCKLGRHPLMRQKVTDLVAVGMAVTCHPPHRSVRAELPHTAPALGA